MGQITANQSRREYTPTNSLAVAALGFLCLIFFSVLAVALTGDPKSVGQGLNRTMFGLGIAISLLLVGYGLICRKTIVLDATRKMMTVLMRVGPFKWQTPCEFQHLERVEYFRIGGQRMGVWYVVRLCARLSSGPQSYQVAKFDTFEKAHLETTELARLVGCPAEQISLGASQCDQS